MWGPRNTGKRIARIIAPSPEQQKVMYRQGNTADIIRVVMYADDRSGEFIRPSAVSYLRGDTETDTLRRIFTFVRDSVRYQADAPGNEVVRSPGYLFQSGTGDCKSYSVAIGALCRAFGIPYRFRFTAPSRYADYQHVYIVATLKDGRDVYMDAVLGIFDQQAPHGRQLDIKPGDRRAIAALHGITGAYFLESTLALLILGGLLFLFAKRVKP